MNISKSQEKMLIILAITLTFVSAVSVDLYLPSLPSMAVYFGLSVDTLQLTMTAFFIGYASLQLLIGPLFDRFGRRPILLMGLVVYLLASLSCAMTDHFSILLLGRALQGVGACCATVASQAIVRDSFDGVRTAQVFSYLTLFIGLSPIFAPILGGVVETVWNWRANFLVLLIFGIAMLAWVIYRFPETLAPENQQSIHIKAIIRNYRYLIKQRLFWLYSILNMCSYIGLLTFITLAPKLLIVEWQIAPLYFGWVFAAAAIVFILGGICNTRSVTKRSSLQLIKWGCYIQLTAAVWCLIASLLWPFSLYVMMPPIMLFFFGGAFIMPNAFSQMMQPFSHMAATASSLLGFLRLVIIALLIFLMSLLSVSTALILAMALMLCSLIGVVSLWKTQAITVR